MNIHLKKVDKNDHHKEALGLFLGDYFVEIISLGLFLN